MKLFLIIISFFISSICFGEGMSCVGMDGTGQTIHLIMDVDTGTININGHILELADGSKDGKTIWTKNYVSDEGILVRGVLTHERPGSHDTVFTQVNAVTKKLIARVPLACKSY